MSIDPASFNVQSFTVSELLSAYGAILDELRRREIVRSANSPLSDYAEVLFCRAFGWTRENNSAAGHDAVDGAGLSGQGSKTDEAQRITADECDPQSRSDSVRPTRGRARGRGLSGHSRRARSGRCRAGEISSCHPYQQ